MTNIQERIEIINSLLLKGTPQYITYAALECRLTIESIVYDRSKLSLDKMSQSEVPWQPKKLINQIQREENNLVTEGLTISKSKKPINNNKLPFSKEDFESQEYVKKGEQAHLNINKMSSFYNALSHLAIHTKNPKTSNDSIIIYGDVVKTKKKVNEVLNELEKMKDCNLLIGGGGEEYSFECVTCNTQVIRKIRALTAGKVIHCNGNECAESYLISFSDGDLYHERRVYDVICDVCNHKSSMPKNHVSKLKAEEYVEVNCESCSKTLYVRLMPTMYCP